MKRSISDERVVLKFTDCQMEPLAIDLVGFSALFDELLGAKDKIHSQDYWDDDHIPLSGAITICFPSIIYCRYMHMRRSYFNKGEEITDCTVIHYELEKYLRIYVPVINPKTLFRVYKNFHKARNIIEEISPDHFIEFINSPNDELSAYSMDVATKIIFNNFDIKLINEKNFRIFALSLIKIINDLPEDKQDEQREQYEKLIFMISKCKTNHEFIIYTFADFEAVGKCISQIKNNKLLLLVLRYIDTQHEGYMKYIEKIINIM